MPEDNEEWRPINGFPRYEVSDLGRVRRYGRVKTLTVFGSPRDRRPWARITLYRNNHPSQRAVHVLVANAFLGERPKGMTVQFRNGDSTDARVENLFYGPANCDSYLIPKKYGRPK